MTPPHRVVPARGQVRRVLNPFNSVSACLVSYTVLVRVHTHQSPPPEPPLAKTVRTEVEWKRLCAGWRWILEPSEDTLHAMAAVHLATICRQLSPPQIGWLAVGSFMSLQHLRLYQDRLATCDSEHSLRLDNDSATPLGFVWCCFTS